jgi:hypothetical protein
MKSEPDLALVLTHFLHANRYPLRSKMLWWFRRRNGNPRGICRGDLFCGRAIMRSRNWRNMRVSIKAISVLIESEPVFDVFSLCEPVSTSLESAIERRQ